MHTNGRHWLGHKSVAGMALTDTHLHFPQQWHFWVMATAVETVLSHRDWQRAFEGTGVIKQQKCISSHTLKALQWDECPKIPDDSLIPYIRTLN